MRHQKNFLVSRVVTLQVSFDFCFKSVSSVKNFLVGLVYDSVAQQMLSKSVKSFRIKEFIFFWSGSFNNIKQLFAFVFILQIMKKPEVLVVVRI